MNVILELKVAGLGGTLWEAPWGLSSIVCPVAGEITWVRLFGLIVDHVGTLQLVRKPDTTVGIELDGIFGYEIYGTKDGEGWVIQNGEWKPTTI